MRDKLKNILILGVENTVLRRKIEYYLRNDYKIIGYSDLTYDADIIQGRNFIKKNTFNEYDIYAIVLCATDKDEISKMKDYIESTRYKGYVVDPKILYYRNCVYVPDLVYEIENNKVNASNECVSGLILGMSYSFFGIDEKKLSGNWLNLSYRGTDMYYNICLCNLALKRFKGIKQILFVMPYYYFQYDMSQIPFEYSSGQIFAVRKLGWHNAERSFDNEIIKNYVICDWLFGDRYFVENRGTKFFYNKDKRDVFFDGNLSHLWIDNDPFIKNENKVLLKKLLDELREKDIFISVVVPPLYANCLRDEDKKIISKRKMDFYNIMDVFKTCRVYDYFDIFKDDLELFWDFEHLNYYGKKVFTVLLNERVCISV